MSETRILIRLLRIYFPRISEFGSASPLGIIKPLISFLHRVALDLVTPVRPPEISVLYVYYHFVHLIYGLFNNALYHPPKSF
jgi:hypothetical protein